MKLWGAPQDCDASSGGGGICNQCPDSDTTYRAQLPGTITQSTEKTFWLETSTLSRKIAHVKV